MTEIMMDEKDLPVRLRTIADALVLGEKVATAKASETLHAAADEIERRRAAAAIRAAKEN